MNAAWKAETMTLQSRLMRQSRMEQRTCITLVRKHFNVISVMFLPTNSNFEMYKKFIETDIRKGGKSLGKYNWGFRRFLQY